MSYLFIEEGSQCTQPDCFGTYQITQDDPCYCNATPRPPCRACEHIYLQCSLCGHSEKDL